MDEIIGMAFSIITLFIILFCLSKIKFGKYQSVLIITVLTLIAYIAFMISKSRFIANVLILILTVFITYKKVKLISFSIFIASLTTIIHLLSSNISQSVIAMLPNTSVIQISVENSHLMFTHYILTLIIAFITSKLLGIFLSKKLNIFSNELKSKFSAYVIFCTLLTLIMFYANIFLFDNLEYHNLSQIICTVLLVIYFLISIVTLYTFTLSTKNTMIAEHRQELLQNLQSYTSHIEGMYDEMRSFRHDYLNIMSSVLGYIESKDLDGLTEYFMKEIHPISDKVTGFNTHLDRLQFIKIPELKGLLAFKLMQAQNLGIKVEIDICEDICGVTFDTVDLCRAVGILIDNAIEECSKNIPGSCIKFAAVRKADTVKLIFINTVNDTKISIPLLFEKGYSTKGTDRGIGLYNLQCIIDALESVSLSTSIEGNEFIQELMCAAERQ